MNLLDETVEGARIAWDAIRANKLRSVLTTVGVVIGIVTVSLMATALEQLDRSFHEAISFLGTDVLYIERLRRLNGLPLSLDLTYIPLDIGTALLGADLENTDVFRLLESITGQGLGHAEITLEAVNADTHSAAVLEAPRGAAVLMLERLTHLADGRPVDLEFIRFRGDRITMSGLLHRSL